ncbi:Extracellular membrane protein CFEM domain-containing protein [Madurella fahalii]|uniref:Extracellular membrane protein CFEM domain-containing protein n=1 Tax=Madurella fahalii TaxID=1157608 RepID=A0ABQ0FWT4_9PEZI
MLRPLTSGLLLWGLLLLSQPTASQAPATFSLPSQPEYNLLSSCGKACLYGSGDVWIGGRLGCSGPYTNDCMCRVDKAPAISSYASECNKNLCTSGDVQQDINTFLSLYNSYCAKNGYTLPGAAANAAEPTGDSATIIGDSTAATVTRVSHATVTAESGGTKPGTGLGKWGALAVVVSMRIASS